MRDRKIRGEGRVFVFKGREIGRSRKREVGRVLRSHPSLSRRDLGPIPAEESLDSPHSNPLRHVWVGSSGEGRGSEPPRFSFPTISGTSPSCLLLPSRPFRSYRWFIRYLHTKVSIVSMGLRWWARWLGFHLCCRPWFHHQTIGSKDRKAK